MTDGFVETFATYVDRAIDRSVINMHSGNLDNNILVMLGTVDRSQATGAFDVNSTQLFKTDAGGGGDFGVIAASQSTTSNGLKTIKYQNEISNSEYTGLALLFTDRKDVFLGKEGRLTRSIIK